MKKNWMLGIVFAVIGSLGLAGAVALGDGNPVVISVVETGSGQAHVAGSAGDEITMSVPLDNAAAAAGVQFELNYPPAMLEVTSLSAGTPPSGSFYTNPDGPTGNLPSNSGFVRVVWANSSASGVSDYVMLNVTFRLIGQEGDVAALTFDEVIIGDAGDLGNLPGRLDHVQNDGSITIQSADQVELLAIDPVTGSSTIVGDIGGQVVVRYIARNASAMAGFQFINRFDNSVVHIPGNAAVDFSVSNFPTELFAGVRNDEGELSIAGASSDSTGIDDVIIADVTYNLSAAPVPTANDVTGDPLCTPLVFDDVTVGDGVPEPLPVTIFNGQICLEEPTVKEPTGVDLAITKSDSVDPVVAGESLIYTLTVTNTGSEPATGITIVDNLPAGPIGFVSASTGCNYDIDTHSVVCNIGDLGSSQSATVEITVDVGSQVENGVSFTNTATVESNENELVPGDNTVSETTDVVREVEEPTGVDLAITKSDSVDPVVAGESLIYTLTVTNTGSEPATGITIVDNLPAGPIGFVSASTGCNYDIDTHSVVCNIGDLGSSQSATVEITVDVGSQVENGVSFTNTATVESNENELVPGDNTVSETTDVVRAADLEVTKSDDSDPIVPGGTLTYTIVVTNNGPSDASDVVLIDTLPAGVEYVSHTTPAGVTCTVTGAVICTKANMDAGHSNTMTITVEVVADAGSTLTNTATVDANENDPDTGNNTVTEDTAVEAPGPEVSISEEILAVLGGTVNVPINFAGNGHEITAATFSVDFDEVCLTYSSTVWSLPTGFNPAALFNGIDIDGELDIAIFQVAMELIPIPDGAIGTMTFTTICDPAPSPQRIAPVAFSTDPFATFSDADSNDVPGTTKDGSVLILGGIRGDCNGDGPQRVANGQAPVTAADLQAVISEIFDGDGDLAINTPGGTFAGNPIGCDANADPNSKITAADLQCIITIIFGGVCGGTSSVSAVIDIDVEPAPLALAGQIGVSNRRQLAVIQPQSEKHEAT